MWFRHPHSLTCPPITTLHHDALPVALPSSNHLLEFERWWGYFLPYDMLLYGHFPNTLIKN